MSKNVISTCLFGSNQKAYNRYAVNAPNSALFCKEYLPDWIFRLYYDKTVNKNILHKLDEIGNVELIEMPVSKGREGCFWRFLAFDDADITICRDLDWKMQKNDLLCIDRFLSSSSIIHFLWVAHARKMSKTKRYYMAGCVGVKNFPFSVSSLIDTYADDKSIFGADEWFLGNYLVPKVLTIQDKIPLYIEPQPKYVPFGKTKEYIEIFPEIEDYYYLPENYHDI